MQLMPIVMKFSVDSLKEELLDQLEIHGYKYVNIGGKEICWLDEATVVSWIMMAVIIVLAFLLTRNLKVEGKLSKRQLLLETCYTTLEDFFRGILGEKGMRYSWWLMSVAIFIGASNMIGMFGFKPPTKCIQVTGAMALTSIILVEFAGIREKGLGGHLKSFAKPVAIVAPINLLELIIKPLSLCMRLFGNIIGAFIIMELLKIVVPVFLPTVFSLYFDLFDGALQAYIFVFLTAIYIQEAIEDDEEEEVKKKSKKARKAEKKKFKKANA